jgi:hypothetical protein
LGTKLIENVYKSTLDRQILRYFQIGVLPTEVLSHSDVPAEAVIKGICKILPIVLPRYQDHPSRQGESHNATVDVSIFSSVTYFYPFFRLICVRLVESLLVHHKEIASSALTASLYVRVTQENLISF